jgi:uncharacterized membrane protein
LTAFRTGLRLPRSSIPRASGVPPLPARAARIALAGTLALALLEVMWEIALAPLGGHPSWLALKAVPLAILWSAASRGARRPRQWLALLLPFYAAEGLARAFGEPGRQALVASAACAVAILAFVALLAWFRAETLRHRKHDALDDA